VIAAHQNMIVNLAFQGAAVNREGYINPPFKGRWLTPSITSHWFAMCIMALEAVYDREAQEIDQ
jgi:hypothetical protein